MKFCAGQIYEVINIAYEVTWNLHILDVCEDGEHVYCQWNNITHDTIHDPEENFIGDLKSSERSREFTYKLINRPVTLDEELFEI